MQKFSYILINFVKQDFWFLNYYSFEEIEINEVIKEIRSLNPKKTGTDWWWYSTKSS